MRPNLRSMAEYCRATKQELARACDWHTFDSDEGYLAMKRTPGARILAVAHMDFLRSGTVHYVSRKRIVSSALDDRAGVYIALNMLPKMGILADVLLTDNEESGGSTIRNLGIGMLDAYNWIVQFDRHGEGAAHYGYTEMIPLLAKHFPSIARGTYTCISAIEACSPCAAFNVGVGYENAHSEKCSLDSAVLQRQMLCFKRFYDEYLDVRLPHHGANAGDEIHTKRYKTVMWGEPQYPKKSHPMSLFADVDSGYYDDAYCGFCHMSVACWEPGYEVTRTKQSLCAACFDVVRDVLCMLPNSASEYTASDIDKIVDGTYCIKFKDRTLDVNGGTWVQTPACWEE